MSTQIRPAPVRKTIFVNAPQDRAFDVFAKGIGRWWPKSHSISESGLDFSVIEPCQGGRWYERGTDGTECEIGKVLAWEPPARLLLAWQLDADWKFHPELITEVEVTFAPEGEGTRVSLEHRHLERVAERAEQMRERIDSPGGWGLLLELFANTAAS